MIILSIDSSQSIGTVTLARADGNELHVIETARTEGGKFSAQLVPAVKRLLDTHSIAKEKIDVIAAASGPGTFTGLRVGLAAAKALAETLGKPILTVSVLEALASTADPPVVAITEAGKGHYYAGVYSRSGSGVEQHCDRDQLRAVIAQHPQAKVVSNADLSELSARIVWDQTPLSKLVARLAIGKAKRQEFTAIDALDANYVRADDALYRSS